MKKTVITLFSSLLLLIIGCIKEDEPLTLLEELPDITMEGLKTFGCLVNEEAYVPNSILGDPHPQISINFSYHEPSGTLKMKATMRGPDFTKRVHLHSIFNSVGRHDILPNPNIVGNYTATGKSACTYKQIIDAQQRLKVTHIDKERKIIAAEFSFDAVSRNCPQDTFRITNGRFDIMYNKLIAIGVKHFRNTIFKK